MTKINEFNRACTLIFSSLYDSFPISINIDSVYVGFIDINQVDNELREIFSATMCFLADEQFIQFDRTTDTKHEKKEVRLTAKGLTRLQKIPEGIQPQSKSLVDQLKDAATSIGGQVSNTATTEAVSQVLKLVFG